jgi:MFS family permease
MSPLAPVADRPASPWGSRNFRMVWAGGLVNDIGDWLLIVALPVFVFSETGSGGATAVLFVIEFVVAVVLGPAAGGLVDRWDLRRTLIATNLLQAVTLLPLLAVTADRVWPAFIVAGVQAMLARLNNPASLALLPRLVMADQLVAANAANATSHNLARLIGSPLGGIVVQFTGLAGVVIADGVSFLAVALVISRVRVEKRGDVLVRDHLEDQESGTRAGSVREGFSLIRRHPVLRRLIPLLGLTQVAQGMFVLLFIAFVVRSLGGGGAEVGILRGLQAIGGIAGGVAIAKVAARVRAPALMGWGLVGLGVTSLLIWNGPLVSTSSVLYAVLFAVVGLPVAATAVGSLTVAQQSTPPEFMGRIMGALGAVEMAGAAVGTIVAGVLVDRVNLTHLLDLQGSIYLGSGILALLLLARSRITPVPQDPTVEQYRSADAGETASPV